MESAPKTPTNTVATGAVIRNSNCWTNICRKAASTPTCVEMAGWVRRARRSPTPAMANKLQFGTMGDYPLIVNGFTFQSIRVKAG